MTTLNIAQIYSVALQAGWSPIQAIQATAIALAESGGRTDVVNSIGAMGLWQIYDGHQPSPSRIAQMSDPLANAQAAFAKFKNNGPGGGWCPWATYDEQSPTGGRCPGSGSSDRNNSWRGFLTSVQTQVTGASLLPGQPSAPIVTLPGTPDAPNVGIVGPAGGTTDTPAPDTTTSTQVPALTGTAGAIQAGLLGAYGKFLQTNGSGLVLLMASIFAILIGAIIWRGGEVKRYAPDVAVAAVAA